MTEQVSVALDVNEVAMKPELHELLEENPDAKDVVVADADADIIVGEVGFERKTWGDYVSSMKDDRLEEQAMKMSSFEASYVLVEGDMSDTEVLTHTDMSGASIRGHMASLTARPEYEVDGVIPCSNLALVADYAVRIGRKHTEELNRVYIPSGAASSDEPPGLQMWACLPGVGPKLAERLYEQHGALCDFMKVFHLEPGSQREALQEVDGIGEERANHIIEWL